ncbi:MAG: hypothetical protein ACYC6L_15605 [Anaerolineae bacterium]
MWNNVVLLASGLALGWTLVNWLVGPQKDVRGNLIRLCMAAAVGLGMAAWLSVTSLSSGLAGLIVVVATAFIAYAANARQASRLPVSLPPHQPQINPSEVRTAVLLVTTAEPGQYNGAAYWAQALRQAPATPHWLLRPFVFRRIRQAYIAMGDSHPLDKVLTSLVGTLSCTFTDAQLFYAYLGEQRDFLARLVYAAEQGVSRLVMVPLEDESRLQEDLHEMVLRSMLTETDLQIIYAPAQRLSITSLPRRQDRLSNLTAGKPVQVSQPAEIEVAAIIQAIEAGLKQADTLVQI